MIPLLRSILVLALATGSAACLDRPRDRSPAGADVVVADGGHVVDSGADGPATDGGAPPVDAGSAHDGGGAGGAGRGAACHLVGDGDDCAEGLTCVTDGTVSICVGFCDAREYTGCLRTESCNIPIDSSRSACSPSCDLLTAAGCPAGRNCGVFADETGAVYKGCDTAGTRVQGDDCDSSMKCAPGHVCAYWSNPPWTSGWECLQYCDLSGAEGPPCPEGTVCSSAPREAEPFAGIDGLGACR